MEDLALRRASSSPHIHAGRTVQGVMLEVIVALVPAGAFGVWYFGWRALLIIAVSAASAVFWEWLYTRMAKKPCTVGDLSAVVTGVLLAYNLPVSVPVWMPVIGTLLAIVLVKMIFGGLGSNFVNPALTARAILMTSWVGYMSGSAYQVAVRGVDAVSTATPLAAQESYSLWQLFIGQCPGCIGEVGRVAILVGGVYLIVRNEQGGLMAYLATAEEGVSGVRHESIGKNLGLADFRVYVDVSGYSDGVYTLGTMLMCMHEGSEIRVSHRFPDALNFVVRGGEIITPVQIEETAEPSAPAASVTPTAPAQTPAA